MKRFPIFRPGQHTSSNGTTLEFTEDDMRRSVEVYDPKIHEAPIVVGHPKDNGPAYGWIQSLAFGESGDIEADPIQVDESFAEMVAAGRFKKRSASFYAPNTPNHPLAGQDGHDTYYLRHVGFLGAMPPAVKGLKDVEFSDDEEGVVEFADPWVTAGVFRRLREWIIGKFGVEEADTVVPDYLVQDLEAEARTPATDSNFSEEPDMTVTNEQLEQLRQENEQLQAQLNSVQNFSEREQQIQERERELAMREINGEINAIVSDGRLTPALAAGLAEFMAGLPEEGVVEFGEGDDAVTTNPRQFMRDFLGKLPKIVDFGEHAADNGDGAVDMSEKDVATKARKYKADLAEQGTVISFTEACNAVRRGEHEKAE